MTNCTALPEEHKLAMFSLALLDVVYEHHENICHFQQLAIVLHMLYSLSILLTVFTQLQLKSIIAS